MGETRIVESENSEIINSKNIATENLNVADRIEMLDELSVNILICGGIDGFSAQQLNFRGVRIYSWITGEAVDALSCLFKGQLESGFMMAPGGCCNGRWRFHGSRDEGREKKRLCLPPDNKQIKERTVINMPRGDGTGPTGQGPGIGRTRGQGTQGRGRMGGPFAAGASGKCLCPCCGHETPHTVGQPCNLMQCPKCGTNMTRS